jgi:signal transduction histidine kinase
MLKFFAFIKKPISLKHIYLNFTLAIVILSIFLSVWIGHATYKEYKHESEMLLRKTGAFAISEFQHRINYAEHLLFYLATKIAQSKDNSHDAIAFLIKQSHTEENWAKAHSWTRFNYINNEGELIVDSVEGIKKQPILAENRMDLLDSVRKDPWRVYFGSVDVGIITKKKILPIGIGIRDNDGKFIGMLSLGIDIEKIVNEISSELEPGMQFIVMDNSLEIISSIAALNNNDLLTHQIIENIDWNVKKLPHFSALTKEIDYGNYIYSHYYMPKLYPFYIILGQAQELYYTHLKKDLLQSILGKIIIGFGCIAILLSLGFQVIKPVIEMSKAANNIFSNNNLNLNTIYNIEELDSLSSKLMQISRMTKDLRYKQAQLTKANNQLAHANAFIKSNISFMSHELKNPTNAIIEFSKYYLDNLQNSAGAGQEIMSTLDMINKAAIYQSKQIDFFLRLFAFQDKGKQLELKEVNFAEIIHWSISMVQYLAMKKRIAILTQIEHQLPNVIGDEIMLSQMVQNLVVNAVKYNKNGGKINVKAFTRYDAQKRRELVLEVSDTGVGMAEKDLKLIFQRFARIKNEATSHVRGYGVGLAYVKNCITLHDV